MLALLGLRDPDGGDWNRLRALQFSQVNQTARLRVVVHAVCASIAILLYAGQAPVALLASFAVALAAALHFTLRIDRLLSVDERPRITRAEINRKAAATATVALAWCIPVLAFTSFAGDTERAGTALLLAALIVGSTLALGVAPFITVVFGSITGLAMIASFLWFGQFGMAIAVAVLLVVVLIGVANVARIHMNACLAEAGNIEKSEVVSLLLREFEENQADWLWQVDVNRLVRSASPRFAFALGKSIEEVEGKPFLELISGEGWSTGQFSTSLHDLAERLKRRESFSNLLVKVFIGREQRWWELSGTPMLDDNGAYAGIRGVGSDVTEQRESSEKIAYLARYDTLTGLPNRLMLTEALGDALRYAEQWRTRCAFLMIDLDRFKSVNDSLGHQVGDKLLAQVSARLKEVLGDNEFCGRLGGDEFAIVIRDATDRSCIERVAKSVIARLSQPYEVDHHTLYVGASVGSAVGPRDGRTVEDLMRNGDLALYRAKDDGGGEHRGYEPALHANAEERRQLEFALRRALENREMELNFQPVVNAQSEEVVSFEALVRWNSPEHGPVRPDKFVPIAEDTRLIVPIGTWVMEQACREATNWPDHVRIAVNVSPEQLFEPDFASTVVQALTVSGLDAQRLELEVTESIFLRDASVARASLEQCLALGCTIALDDFGTGYSSLGYLRKLPFSTIKIDRSFVQGAAQSSKESLAIIRAVVAMADALEMTTTAEGVESAEEAELIRKLGCTKIQGYYFGRPMRAPDALQLFRRRQSDAPDRLRA
ncbi:Cyclic di-GMP phosphodiesterase Gmr [Tsuneonella dongtanensis]|uniref:Cyclic di-GMP phosphodiesterase Gmr n=1 Tax=Tsuneonella dongtanensis TaxID=692370 RepID=A0A1B2AGT2_9SPHN|nr:EAL domain-containing protein [Tsuneonella dongtanensis]ANY21356.1 Cyclic di-GMP phosphodiesterase Gmr [Tsuneonella dongtanensis]